MKRKIVYTATDSDGDAIGGSFSATVSSTQQTLLDLSSALTSSHFDHLMKPDTGERMYFVAFVIRADVRRRNQPSQSKQPGKTALCKLI